MSTKNNVLKFTKNQLANFSEVEKKALAEPSVLESLRYILAEIYKCGVYVFDRIQKENTKAFLETGNLVLTDMSSHTMLKRLEEIKNLLTSEELKYINGLRWVYEHQLAILKLYTSFDNVTELRKPTNLLNQYRSDENTNNKNMKESLKQEKEKHSSVTSKVNEDSIKDVGYIGLEIPGKSIPYRIKPFFDDVIIFQQLNDLEVDRRLPYIRSVLEAIKNYFRTDDIYKLPLHIRLLRRQLEGQEMIYENLTKAEVTRTKAPVIDPSKRSWSGTKSEFARLIIDSYGKDRDKYKSLKKAAETIFDEYLFEDQKWTKEKCYDLVRKN